jgi:type II secretion system protein D
VGPLPPDRPRELTPAGASSAGEQRDAKFVGPIPPERTSATPTRTTRVPSASGPGEETTARGETGDLPVRPAGGEEAVAVPAPAADGKTEWFAFDGMPWEEVVKKFAERLGKPLMNAEELTIGGELTYKNPNKFTKQEALDELNLILHEKGYRFVELPNYIYVVPLSEMPQTIPVERTYPTVSAFQRDNIRDMEYCSVFMDVKDQSAQRIVEMFGDAIPDYGRVSVFGDTNKVKLVALARDIRKMLALMNLIQAEGFDPRITRIVPIKTNAREIERIVRELFNLGGVAGATPTRTTRTPRQPTPEQPGQTPEQRMNIQIIADDRTNTLILRGVKDELDKVEDLIKRIDEKPEIGEFNTTVVEVRNGNAVDIAELLNRIFQQEQGQSPAQALRQQQQRFTRGAQPGQPQPQVQTPQQVTPQDIFVEDIYERAKKTIRLVADERTNSLIVYANADGLKRLREMLEIIDQPMPSNFRTFKLAHADAEALQTTIDAVVRGMASAAPSARPGGAARGPVIVPDPATNSLHVVADREDMKRVEEIVARLDIVGAQDEKHIVQPVNLTPSRLKELIEPFLANRAGAGGGISPAQPSLPRRGRAGGARAAATPQLIPIDEANILIVMCSADEWEKIEPTIKLADGEALSDKPQNRFFEIQHGDIDAIARTLQQLYTRYRHPTLGESQVVVSIENGRLLVNGIKPALDEIASLITSLDVPPQEHPLVILPLRYGDATEVANLVQQVVLPRAAGGGAAAVPRPRGGGVIPGAGGSDEIVQPDAATNSLIIRADAETVEKIKTFVKTYEDQTVAQTPETRFFTLQHAAARDVASAITQLFAGSAGRGSRFGGPVAGSRVSAFPVGDQVAIEAPADKMQRIEEIIRQLDDPGENEILVKTVKLPGADVAALAARLTSAFSAKAQKQNSTVRIDADPSSETLLMTVSKDMQAEVEKLLTEFEETYRAQVVEFAARPLTYATATDAAAWLREPLVNSASKQIGRTAAQQISVSADPRTNRVLINAPQVAVKMAMTLLDQYDVQVANEGPPPQVLTETMKLPGLNVSSIANSLNQVYSRRPPRPDKLQYSFLADPASEMLIYTIPVDAKDDLEKELTKFSAEVAELAVEQHIYDLKHGDAGEVANQLRENLSTRIRNQRGAEVAGRLSVLAEPRLNRVIVNVPKFAQGMADELIDQLDQKATVEFPAVTIELNHADPTEVMNMINNIFGSGRRDSKNRTTQNIQATVTNNTLIVRAPEKELTDIRALIEKVDATNPNELQVEMFPLKVMDATTVAVQVAAFLGGLGGSTKKGELRPGAFPEPRTNTLVVMAPAEQMPFIKGLIAKIESTPVPGGELRAYQLNNVLADQVAPNVKTMLSAKVLEKEGATRQKATPTEVIAEPAGNRLLVFVPKEYHELATELIRMVDEDVKVGEVTHIIGLQQAEATSLATTVRDSLAAQAGAKPGAAAKVRIVADAGSNSLIVSGLPKNVADAEKLINELESTSAQIPELQIFQLNNTSSTDVMDTLTSLFGTGGKTPADAVTIAEDTFYNKLIVTANRRKMRQVEEFIKRLDAPPTEAESKGLAGTGKEIYFVDVYRGDPFDIAWDVSEFFPPEDKGGPSIDADWFGEYIKVVCRPSEFPKIEEMIRKFDARSKVETKTVLRKVGNLDRILPLLAAKMKDPVVIDSGAAGVKPQLPSLIETLWSDDEAPPGAKPKKLQIKPASDANGGNHNTIDPFLILASTTAWIDEALESLREAAEDASSAQTPQTDEPARREPPRAAETPKPPTRDASATPPPTEPPLKREPVKISVMPDGRVVIAGTKSQVDDLEDAIDLLQEDLALGQVIRIFAFKYGDAAAAGQILDRMFNERQVRIPQQVQQPQQPQQRGGRGEGQAGREGGDQKNQQQTGMMEQIQRMIGERQAGGRGGQAAGGERVRWVPEPGHNFLIVKCDEADLPEIRQLLRELDIPPGQVDVRVFQLKNLDATETAQNIKQVLGISKAEQRRGAGLRGAGGPQGGGQQQQQQLMEMLQQQLVTLGGEEGGTKIESVEIVPNQVTNALLVSSPPDVMKIIEDVLERLEALESRDITVIRHLVLEKGKVDDILPILQEIFGDAAGGGGRGARAAGGKASPAQLGPVQISGDPRSNTIIFTAEAKDVPIVEAQIRALDIPGSVAEVETYVCKFGDAESIAAAVEAAFAGGAGGGGGRRGGGAAAAPALAVRVTAEPTTNTILVWGPQEQRDLIFAKIEELDTTAKFNVREIPVLYAKPETLAERLNMIFGGQVVSGAGGGGRPGRGGGAGTLTQTTGRIVIVPDKSSKKLLVRAPDHIFSQMEDLVATLDKPSEQLQLRTFALKHADAQAVVDSVKAALQEYVSVQGLLGGGAGERPDIDAFTAMADPRTNSVIVVGSTETFTFVEQILRAVDVITPDEQQKQFRIFVLDKTDATTVAEAINNFASQGAAAGGARPAGGPGGGRRGGFAPGGGSVTGATLSVTAFAEPATNAVMVFGRPEDIETVAEHVIKPLEGAVGEHRTIASIPVTNATASQVASFITQFMDETAARTARGGRPGAAGVGQPPTIIPNDVGKRLVVKGSQAQIDEIQDLVDRFDDTSLVESQVKVIKLPFGVDAAQLGREVERVINEGERIIAESTGRVARRVAIGADPEGTSLIVYAEPSMYGTVETVVNQLGVGAGNVITRVIELKNLTSTDVQGLIDDLQNKRGGTSVGGVRRTSTPSLPSAQPSTPRRSITPAPQAPRGSTPSTPARPQQRPSGGQRPQDGGRPRPQPGGPGGGGGGDGGGGGGNRGGTGGGAWMWSPPAREQSATLPRWYEPFIATMTLTPSMPLLTFLDLQSWNQQSTNADEQSTATAGAAAADERASQPAFRRPAAAEQPASQPERPSRRARPDRAGSQPARAAQSARTPTTAGAADSSQPATRRARPDPRAAETQAAPATTPVSLTQPAEPTTQPLTAFAGELRGDVVATPIDSRRIIITGDENDVAFIEQMLSLMEATAEPSQIEIFALQRAKAAVIAPIIERTLQARISQVTDRPGRVDEFSIIAEARSNSLIVTASESNMELVRQLIEKLDLPDIRDLQFKLVQVEHVNATQAAAKIRPIIERLYTIGQVPRDEQASIEPDDRNNTILILGTPAEINEIEELIKAYDVELPDTDARADWARSEMVIIGLKNGDADAVATVIADMIRTEQESARDAAGGTGAAGGARPSVPFARRLRLTLSDGTVLPEIDLEKPIRILPEKGTNSIIVFSTPKNTEPLKQLIAVFDTLPAGSEIEVKSFALKHGNAAAVADMLQEMFDDAKKALQRSSSSSATNFDKGVLPPMPPGLAARGLPYNVIITSDERSNTLLIVGHKDAVLLAAGLINEIDRPASELPLQPHIITLRSQQASVLRDNLTEMLDQWVTALGGDENAARDNAVIIADDRSNSLIVLATPDRFKVIETLAQQIDRAESYTTVDSRFRRLEYADAAKLASLLQELFDKKKQADQAVAEKGQKNELYVIADARSNSLMLTGTRDYLQEAETLIGNLDKSYDPTVTFKVRPVKLNSASNIATLLQDMIDKSRADDTMKGTPIHVAADAYSNNLLLAASKEDMLMLERWVEVLDRPAEPGRVIRIIPLARGSAEELSQRAEELFQTTGGGGGGGGGGDDLTVTFEPATNSVIAIGPPAVVNDVEDLIRKLNASEAQGGQIVRIFKLNQADAEDTGELLRSILENRGGSVGGRTGGGTSGGTREGAAAQVLLLYQQQHAEKGVETLKALRPDVVVIDDVRTNSLVVMAPPDSMPLMESLITAVDVPPDSAQIRVFPLRNADAEKMVEMLKELFEPSAAGGGGTGGTTDEQQRQLTLGEGLSEGGRQELTFTTDLRTNSVIAAGTKGYLDLVENLIVEIDSRGIEDRRTMVYTPRNNQAKSIAASLMEYNDAQRQRLQELEEDISAERRQEREILAIANEDSNTMLIDYSPRFEGSILDIVKELDQPPPQVMIKVLVIEVTMEDSLELGVEFAWQDLQWTKAGPTDTTTFDYVGGADIGAAGSGLGGFTFTITGADFDFLLRALQAESDIKVLSRPQIVAMDNQEAEIKVVQDVPYVNSTSTSIAGQITTQVARATDIGITLNVTPQINPDGWVRLEIEQQVSDLTDSTVQVAPGVSSPIFFRRQASTTVTVMDNETIVLGGLIGTRETHTENKVPLAGDVPIIGTLFRSQVNRQRRSELLIILTPTIVRTVEDFRELSIQERDRTGLIGNDVLMGPLMEGLRVRPQELPPADETIRPETETDRPRRPSPPADEEYGPQIHPAPGNGTHGEPASYDVPITRRMP